MLILVRRLRCEFRRPNLYLLLLVFRVARFLPLFGISGTPGSPLPTSSRARQSGRTRPSSARVAHLLGEHFATYFSVFPRVGLGDNRELAAHATKISKSSISSGLGCRSFSFTRSSPATKRPRQTGMPSLYFTSAFLRFPTGGNGGLPARARAIGQMPRCVLALFMSASLIGLMVNPFGIGRRGHDPERSLARLANTPGRRQGPE